MATGLPESYRRLAAFSRRLSAGTRLYEPGEVPQCFYVVLAGEVLFEILAEGGEPETAASARPGDLVGHVAAFTRRPTSAAAHVEREAVVIAIPVARLLEALREAPELGVQLIRALTGSPELADTQEAPEADAHHGAPAPAAPVDGAAQKVTGPVDGSVFFTDTVVCPVSGTSFEFLRVRTRAVRPAERDSDFRIRYEGVDPTRYGVVVCPTCAYAAYLDDFTNVDDEVRARLWADREGRIALAGNSLNRVRDEHDATIALELAMRCYELRGANESRRAVLQHRRAWMERDAQDDAGERAWLLRARESYQRAYEHDTRISDEAAARVAYLVGDISMRLGEATMAAQWLETAIRVAPKERAGVVRSARERLHDVRTMLQHERRAS